jgi:hypothetical protein
MVTACCREICSSGVLMLAGDQEVKEAAVRRVLSVPDRLAATRQDPGEAASFNCCKLARGSPWRGTRVGTGLGLWRSRYSSYTRTALHVDGLQEVMLILVLELLLQYPPLATAPPQRCLPSKEHLVLVPCLVKRDTALGFLSKKREVNLLDLLATRHPGCVKENMETRRRRMSRRNQVRDKRLSVEAWLSWEGRGGQSCLEISKK